MQVICWCYWMFPRMRRSCLQHTVNWGLLLESIASRSVCGPIMAVFCYIFSVSWGVCLSWKLKWLETTLIIPSLLIEIWIEIKLNSIAVKLLNPRVYCIVHQEVLKAWSRQKINISDLFLFAFLADYLDRLSFLMFLVVKFNVYLILDCGVHRGASKNWQWSGRKGIGHVRDNSESPWSFLWVSNLLCVSHRVYWVRGSLKAWCFFQ